MRPIHTLLATALAAAVVASGTAPLAQPARGQIVADAPGGRSQGVVQAADAFLASLAPQQRSQAQYAFGDDAQRRRWSNFPQAIFQRTGLRWGDMTPAQRDKLTALLGEVLSSYGVQMVRDQMGADDVLKANPGLGGGPGGPPPPGGGPPGSGGPPGGDPGFGADNYFVAFLGTPSATSPWMLQFGGHHLAINATVVGDNLTLSPSLTGGQPTRYEKDGKAIYIVDTEVRQANAMLAGLSDDQRRKAVVSPQRIDLVLGPGHDGQVLQPEGLPASAMNDVQKVQLVKLIEARLGILNPRDLGVAMAAVRRNLDQTSFAWFGPTADAGSAYFRVTGPTLILEFSPQGLGGDPSNHLHNMYRDPTNEYGAAWIKAASAQ